MMNKLLLLLFIFLNFQTAEGQQNELPADYLRDSLPASTQRAKDLLDHAYMAQTLLATTDSLPGWEGFPVKLYEYKTSPDLYTHQPKTAKVYLLNPMTGKSGGWMWCANCIRKHGGQTGTN